MHSNASPSVIVNRLDHEWIVGGFLAAYPPKTRDQYRHTLGQWCRWVEGHGVPMMEVRRPHVDAWARHLEEERRLKPATVAGYLSTIRMFYRFAHDEEVIDRDPARHVKSPRVPFRSTTDWLTRAEAHDLIGAARYHGPMAFAMVTLLLLNGLRVGELLAIDIEDLGFQSGYQTVHLKRRKGGKTNTLGLCQQTAWAVQLAAAGRTSGPLLLGRDSERWQVAAVRRRLRTLTAQCGITKRITPHSLRHTFVTLSLAAGVSPTTVQKATDHASLEMVGYYDRSDNTISQNPTHQLAVLIDAAA